MPASKPLPRTIAVTFTGTTEQANRLIAIVNEAVCLIDPSAQIACDGFWPHALGPDVVGLAAKDRPRPVNLSGGSYNATGA
ncbi:hypothetical protein ACI797_17735 [Geodermatophilus sp. SYSU D00691]